jgi:hypothetical protein
MIQSIQWLIHTSCDLLLENVDDFVEEASGDQNVLVDPRCVQNGWNLHWHEVVIMKAALLCFCPLIYLEDVCCELHFLRPQEARPIELQSIKSILCEL